jgi:hypothetical protein
MVRNKHIKTTKNDLQCYSYGKNVVFGIFKLLLLKIWSQLISFKLNTINVISKCELKYQKRVFVIASPNLVSKAFSDHYVVATSLHELRSLRLCQLVYLLVNDKKNRYTKINQITQKVNQST